MTLEDSSTYQAILEKGRLRGLQTGLQTGLQQGLLQESRSVLLRFGTRRFGAADSAILEQLNSISDLERLHRMQEVLLERYSWDELLQVR